MKKLYFPLSLIFLLLLLPPLANVTTAGNVYSFHFDNPPPLENQSQSLYLKSGEGLNVTSSWTFEVWIFVDTVSGYDDIMFRNGIFSFQTKNPLGAGDFAVDFYNRDNGSELSTDATQDLNFNTWYHIAATFDGTTAKLYVNATMVDSDNNSTNWNLVNNTNYLNIGARYISGSGYSNYYSGQIDELRISDVARTVSEMQTSYSEEKYIVDSHTLLLMHFDDQSSPPTFETGTGYGGTVYNHNTSTTNYESSAIEQVQLLRPKYQSKASGNWNNNTTWQYFNGSAKGFVDASLIPDFHDDTITILTGHEIIVDADITLDQTIVQVGGKLSITDGIDAELHNGTDTDLDVYGTFRKSGSLTRLTGASIVIENGATYQHDSEAAVSTATWEDGSTCEIVGVGSNTTFLELDNVGQDFYNFTWNSSTQNRNVGLQGLTKVLGNFSMLNSNGKDVRLVTSTTDKSLYIHGNAVISGGTLELTNASGDCYFVCYGNFTQTGGELTAPGTGTGYLRFGTLTGGGLSGTFMHTGGIFAPEDIQINKSYFLTIASDMGAGSAPVKIKGKVTVQTGSTVSTTDKIILYSESDYQGSLINQGSINATVDVQCYTTSGQWHGISAPLQNQTAHALYLNGNPDVWVKNYDETDNSYHYITSLDTDLGDMEGWMVWIKAGSSPQTFTFSGNTRTGTVGSDNNLTRSGAGNDYGYNFMGNPFTSAIDWEAASGITKTNLEDAIYVYNNGNWASYINGTGTNGGSSHIAMNQGFFVQVKDNGGSYPEYGTLKINSDACVHSDTAFLKGNKALNNLLRLQISNGTWQDETVIRFSDNASQEWDSNMDAHKLFSFNPDYPQIFSTDNGFMSINTVSPATEKIPLDVKGKDNQMMTISLTENTTNYDAIFLKDNLTGEYTNLLVSDFTFVHDAFYSDRFEISFLITGEAENRDHVQHFTVYASNQNINVRTYNQTATVHIYNLLGQQLLKQSVKDGINTFFMHEPGIYLVKIATKNQVETHKVFVN